MLLLGHLSEGLSVLADYYYYATLNTLLAIRTEEAGYQAFYLK